MAIHKYEYIHRDIEDVLQKSVSQFPATAITGPRQSGKSTLVNNLFGKTHHLISFDDPVTRERAISDPRLLIESVTGKIAFDEIQYVPEILSYIKILIDKDRHKYGRFIITGSQQFHLIKNLGDTLAGRIALFDLLPFSLNEKSRVFSLKDKLSDTQNCFLHTCLRGSFPEITIHANIEPPAWYGSYLQTYLERDVRTVYNVGILREFQQFLRLLAARCSQILNLSSFASDIGVSVNTIKKWISLLEASRIIYVLPPYYQNLGKRITKNPKIYFLDVGLVCYLTGLDTQKHLLSGPMAGALFECFVIQETVKYLLNKGVRPRLYYLRTHNNVEVDLIIEKNLRLYPLEIKLTKTANPGMTAHMQRFKKIFSKLEIGEGKIICLSDRQLPLTEDITAIGVRAYLKWLEQVVG